MQKKLKKWGNSLVMTFNKEEQEIEQISEGDIVDLQINSVHRGSLDIEEVAEQQLSDICYNKGRMKNE